MAFVVDDLDAEHARLKGLGFAPKDIKEMTHEGEPFGRFFFIDDPDGYKIEVLQRGGRFK
jgi:lactoylglutathione lyase